MAITSNGYDGQVSEDDAARIAYGIGYGAAPSVVVTGWDVSVGVGTRALAISAGSGVATFVHGETTAAETINAPANSSGSTVKSYVIVKYDWTGSPGTTTFETKGTGVSLPALTQTPGVTWEMPLATFDVANGASVVSNIKICKPRPRFNRYFPSTPGAVAQIFAANPGYTLATQDLADPGWNYRVEVSARIRVRTKSGTPGGVVLLSANCDGTQIGEAVSNPLLSGLTETSGVTVDLVDVSPVKSGPCSIDLITTPGGSFPSPGSYEVLSGFNRFIVKQVPVTA